MMGFDPSFATQVIAARVPVAHARAVLDAARTTLHRALAEQPRDRAWRPGPLDSREVLAANDSVERWSAVVALHERHVARSQP